jgi:hypothetical protein
MKIVLDMYPSHCVLAEAGSFEPITELKSQPVPMDVGYAHKSRVVMTKDTIVAAEDQPDGVKIIFQETYTEPPIVKDGEYWLTTNNGRQMSFKKDTGDCGCGSRLPSWNPYKALISIKDTQK